MGVPLTYPHREREADVHGRRFVSLQHLLHSWICCCVFLMLSGTGGMAQGVIFKVVESFPITRVYAARLAGFTASAAVGGSIGNFSTDGIKYIKNALKPGDPPDTNVAPKSQKPALDQCVGFSCFADKATGTDLPTISPVTTPPLPGSPKTPVTAPSDLVAPRTPQTNLHDPDKAELNPASSLPNPFTKSEIEAAIGHVTEQIPPPPAPPGCEQPAMDGMTAMKRGVVLDSDTGFSKQNEPAARHCFMVAASQNIPLAQYNLADMLIRGEGGPADATRGMQYLEAAAVNGLPLAQYRLAQSYETANPPNLVGALHWYGEAAFAGATEAQYELARFFYQGLGLNVPDRIAAFGWLNIALEKGYQPAKDTMHALLDDLSRSAKAYQPDALFAMGRAWEEGVPGFIAPDPRRAFLFYLGAKREGWLEADAALHHLCDGNNFCR
jgi:TPR repeat protein